MNSTSDNQFDKIEKRLGVLEDKFSTFEQELQTKAGQKSVDEIRGELAQKSDQKTVDEIRKELSQKADQKTVDEIRKELAQKADQKTVDEIRKELAQKADQKTVDEIRKELAQKADQKTVEVIRKELTEKADKKDLELVAQQVAQNTIGIEDIKGKVDYNSQRIDRLVAEVTSIREDIKLLETKADADKKFNLLLAAIDGLAKKIDDYRTEKFAVEHTFTRHENKLDNHEKRIAQLEITSS